MNRALPVALLALLGLPACAASQERADRVEFLTRVKDRERATTTRTGFILEETPAKVVLRLTGGDRLEIPADDVVDISYEGAPSAVLLAKGSERAGQWEAAIGHWEKALKELPAGLALARPSIRLRLVDLKSRLAGAKAEDTLADWRQFVREFPSARQTPQAWEKLGEALLRDGQTMAEAAAGLETLRRSFPDPRLVLRCDLAIARLGLAQAESLAAQADLAKAGRELALSKLEPLAKKAEMLQSPEFRRLWVQTLARCGRGKEAAKLLEDRLASADNAERPQLLWERGELLRAEGNWAAARWDYLRLELLYPQRTDLLDLARDRLAEVFEKLGDTARAEDYRRLPRGKN